MLTKAHSLPLAAQILYRESKTTDKLAGILLWTEMWPPYPWYSHAGTLTLTMTVFGDEAFNDVTKVIPSHKVGP